jgi:hypothetical protein
MQFVNNIVRSTAGPFAIDCDTTYGGFPPTFTSNDLFATVGTLLRGSCVNALASGGNISADPQFAREGRGALLPAHRGLVDHRRGHAHVPGGEHRCSGPPACRRRQRRPDGGDRPRRLRVQAAALTCACEESQGGHHRRAGPGWKRARRTRVQEAAWLQTKPGHLQGAVRPSPAAITGRSTAAASTERCTFVSGHSTASSRMAVHERLIACEVIGCSRPRSGLSPRRARSPEGRTHSTRTISRGASRPAKEGKPTGRLPV